MLATLFLILGILFIIAGLLYIQKPTLVLAFWRKCHILSDGTVNTSVFGVIVLVLGIVILVYSFLF